MFGPHGATFRPYRGRVQTKQKLEWERKVIVSRDTIKNGRALMPATDFWKHRTFERAIEQGLVRALPNKDAYHPSGGLFPYTKDRACV